MIVPERLHSLDAVRAFALLSGIVLHAAMSFLPGFGSVGFTIIDQSPSLVLGLLFFVIHSFRMSLFFFIAGYFAHLQFHRRGLRDFLRDRGKRIALPLIIGWPILFPLVVLPIILAALQHPAGVTQPPPPPNGVTLAFPLLHLWFLYVLCLLYLLVLSVRAVLISCDRGGQLRLSVDRCLRGIITNPAGVIVLATPASVALAAYPYWVPWMGIPTPDTSLIPNSPALIAFFTAFSFGWLMHRQPDLLSIWKNRWKLNLLIAISLSVAALTIVGPIPRYSPEEPGGLMVLYAACYSLSTWCWIFAFMGIGLQFFSAPSHQLRYLADSSYWLYLIHLPLVFLAQATVMSWNIHWIVKFPMILLVTVPLMLVSYHYCVRSTFVGGLLNGRRYQRIVHQNATGVAAVVNESGVDTARAE